MKNADAKIIALRIKIACVENRISQVDLAASMDMSYKMLQDRLSGRVGWKVNEAYGIANVLGKNFEDVFLS